MVSKYQRLQISTNAIAISGSPNVSSPNAGNFNCRHADWGYDDKSLDDECLAGWASINCLALLYNTKNAASFYSSRWNTGTNPDLAFASLGPNSRLPDRRVHENFPSYNIYLCLLHHHSLLCQCQACL